MSLRVRPPIIICDGLRCREERTTTPNAKGNVVSLRAAMFVLGWRQRIVIRAGGKRVKLDLCPACLAILTQGRAATQR